MAQEGGAARLRWAAAAVCLVLVAVGVQSAHSKLDRKRPKGY